MFDMPIDEIVLAQAQTQMLPALVAPAPNWTTPYPATVKDLIYMIQNNLKPSTLIKYSEDSSFSVGDDLPPSSIPDSLGLPKLVWQVPAMEMRMITDEDGTHPERKMLTLASYSCFLFDLVASQVGAWGAECKIVRYLEMPKGQVDAGSWPGTKEGDVWYTPTGGLDKIRFILGNGAGRQIDVTVYIHAMDQSIEDDESQENDGKVSSPNSKLNAVPDAGYTGEDKVIALADIEGGFSGMSYIGEICYDNLWKISQPSLEDYNTPDSWYRATSLYALLTGAAFHRGVRRGLFPANWASDIVDIPAGERDV